MGWLPKDKVVVPIDFSDESLAAVEVARTLVKDCGHLYVMHVLPPMPASDPELFWETETCDKRRADSQERMRQRFADGSHEGMRVCVKIGDAGGEIAAYAEEVHAELIVIPSHGRTGLSRLLIGSVAERVCRLSHCPVLVLRS